MWFIFQMPLGSAEAKKGSSVIKVRLDQCTPLVGNIKVEVYYKSKMIRVKDKLFHFWINTFFVIHGVDSVREKPLEENGNLNYLCLFGFVIM